MARLGRGFRPRRCRNRQKLAFEYLLSIARLAGAVAGARQNPPDLGGFLCGHAAVLVEIERLVSHDALASIRCASDRSIALVETISLSALGGDAAGTMIMFATRRNPAKD